MHLCLFMLVGFMATFFPEKLYFSTPPKDLVLLSEEIN